MLDFAKSCLFYVWYGVKEIVKMIGVCILIVGLIVWFFGGWSLSFLLGGLIPFTPLAWLVGILILLAWIGTWGYVLANDRSY